MKTPLIYIGLLLLTPFGSRGQAIRPSLNNDPDFRQALLQAIRYPVAAQQAQKVAKAYVEFTVDHLGKVTQVQVLNQAHVEAVFQEEVNRLMSQLPTQKPAYRGKYVLPLSFELEGHGRTIKSRQEDASFRESLPKQALLQDTFVIAYLN